MEENIKQLRILVIGSGGREHALVHKLSLSSRVAELYCIPGNPGIARLAECANIPVSKQESVLEFVQCHQIDLVVIGPEQPLVDGLSDILREHGILVFGPSQAAARLEGSKYFAKQLMNKYGIPTAQYQVFTELAAAKNYIVTQPAPLVIKADGLAAGKGVVVAQSQEEALTAVEDMMGKNKYGQAGQQVVIEECLQGQEVSVLAFTDGKTILPMPPAQDYKRIGEGDTGPNTGGMGAYAPAPILTKALQEQVQKQILQPLVQGMATEGNPFSGCLYAGLMITQQGPKVIEFNARFGDPETEVLLPLLESDLPTLLIACAQGTLEDLDIRWSDQKAVCVVLASAGYPEQPRIGEEIRGIEEAVIQGVTVYHSGTTIKEGQLQTAGGRVITASATGATFAQAIDIVYAGVEKIQFAERQFRKDIAARVR